MFIYNPRVYHTLTTNTIGRYNLQQKHEERAHYSLRKITVYENSPCTIAIQQKEGRFFCKAALKYSYIWVRAILVQREYNGYHWI